MKRSTKYAICVVGTVILAVLISGIIQGFPGAQAASDEDYVDSDILKTTEISPWVKATTNKYGPTYFVYGVYQNDKTAVVYYQRTDSYRNKDDERLTLRRLNDGRWISFDDDVSYVLSPSYFEKQSKEPN